MPNTKPFPDPASARPLTDEADIGSGEKTPAQLDTERMIGQIPALPESDDASDEGIDASDDDDVGSDTAGGGRERREHDASLLRDEPADDVNALDPAPPKGR